MASRTAAPALPSRLPEAAALFLRHGSPRLLLTCVLLALGVRLSLGRFSMSDLLPVTGLLALWPVQEWLIHVFILHYRPVRILGRTLDFRLPRSHRAHHAEPWRPELVFIPLHSFVYSLPLLAGAWWLVAPTPALAFAGITGHLLLTLHYEWVHFLMHTQVVPQTALYRRLWRNHRLHHFKNEHYWFGVTLLAGDRILGTAPDPKTVVTSSTCRALPGSG
ncbi:MAG: sterol desaturase family protein [Myxococcota bacterium]